MKKHILPLIFLLPLFFTCCIREEPVWSRPVSEKTFSEAVDYCTSLKENGVSGWRLPTTAELSGLNESSGYYWSSDPTEDLNKNKKPEDEARAWLYDFSAKKKNKSLVLTHMNVVCTKNVDEKQAATIRENAEKDEIACESAMEESKTNGFDPWIKYMQKFQNGMCTAEAEDAVCEYLKKNNDDEAKKEDDEKRYVYAWTEYLKLFPNGKCAKEANDAREFHIYKKIKGTRESDLYKKAKERNTRAAWEKYLREFEADHIYEAKYKLDELKQREPIGYLEWSDRSYNRMKWEVAEEYCKNLQENGSGWHLPDIDELRMLVQNSKTAAGGTCKVSEKNECLISGDGNGCWTWETCAETCTNKNFEDCDNKDDGRYSKLGDAVWLWSSSISNNPSYVWSIDFRNGHIGLRIKKEDKNDAIFVRCVR